MAPDDAIAGDWALRVPSDGKLDGPDARGRVEDALDDAQHRS
jgi:hypothetical protein